MEASELTDALNQLIVEGKKIQKALQLIVGINGRLIFAFRCNAFFL